MGQGVQSSPCPTPKQTLLAERPGRAGLGRVGAQLESLLLPIPNRTLLGPIKSGATEWKITTGAGNSALLFFAWPYSTLVPPFNVVCGRDFLRA